MSNMATEMAARMREDGRDPSTETITPGAPLEESGAAAPGTGTAQPPQPAVPPAGALNADTQSGEGEPGPVPYSRFREVNEGYQKLRGYEPLMQYGYDPDSLSRLANFEAAWVSDAHGTVAQLVDNLDLPDEAKGQIRSLLEVEDGAAPSAGGGTPSTPTDNGTEGQPPEWARKIQERFDREDQARLTAQEQEQREAALAEVESRWRELDQQAGIPEDKTARESIRMALIANLASTGRFPSTAAIAEAAWQEWAAEREVGAGSAVVRPGSGPGPASVPRSAAVPAPPQKFGGDIKAATRAAQAAMERGELPTIVPGG